MNNTIIIPVNKNEFANINAQAPFLMIDKNGEEKTIGIITKIEEMQNQYYLTIQLFDLLAGTFWEATKKKDQLNLSSIGIKLKI